MPQCIWGENVNCTARGATHAVQSGWGQEDAVFVMKKFIMHESIPLCCVWKMLVGLAVGD